jgi:hypothetical protein
MKAVGQIQVTQKTGETKTVPAFKIGRYWALTGFYDYEAPKEYTVTHKSSGLAFLRGVPYRQAIRMIGVMDALFPTDDVTKWKKLWTALPNNVKDVLIAL